MTEQPRCQRCKIVRPIADFTRYGGVYQSCNLCSEARKMGYRNCLFGTPEGGDCQWRRAPSIDVSNEWLRKPLK